VKKGKEEKSHSFLFSTFFTFLGNPLKIFKSKNVAVTLTHPTMNITSLCSPHDTLQGGGGFIVIG